MRKLYPSPGTSSMAPHIMLNEVGAPFEVVSLSLKKKDTHTPEFLAMSPEGKVPVLMIDGKRLTEVAGILYYLARKFPEKGLFPAGDIEAEAQVISWMSYLASSIHPSRAKGDEHCLAMWKLADQRLGKNEWCLGSRYSIADIHFFRLYWRQIGALKPPRGTFPNAEAHHDRMMLRAAFKKTIKTETNLGYDA